MPGRVVWDIIVRTLTRERKRDSFILLKKKKKKKKRRINDKCIVCEENKKLYGVNNTIYLKLNTME